MKYNQLLLCLVSAIFTTSSIANITTPNEMRSENLQDIYLAGGCFWGIEAYMEKIYGVKEATSGYANGKTEQTAYRIIGQTDHAETVHVTYDANKISLEKLLQYYFKVIDPTSKNKQGNDIGRQYRTGIYYQNEQDKQIILKEIQAQQAKYKQKIQVQVEQIGRAHV